MNYEEQLKRLTDEQLKHKDEPIYLALSPSLLLSVIAAVQVALRQPRMQEQVIADQLREFLKGSIQHLKELGLPETVAAAELGNTPRPEPTLQ